MLAVGCNDGRIALWDFMTRGISRQCSHHIHLITSLSWNRTGRKLLRSVTDWNVVLWDVVSGEAEFCLRFPSPVAKVQFNLRDKGMFLVCPMRHTPTLVTLRGSCRRCDVGGGGAGTCPLADQQETRDFDDRILQPSRETDNHRKLKGKGMT